MVHRGPVVRVGFADSGTRVVTASQDMRVTVWEARARSDAARLLGQPVERGPQSIPTGVELAIAGEHASQPAILSRWRPEDGIVERSIDKGARTRHLAMDGRRLWAAQDERAVVWDVGTMMPVQT